MSLFREKKLKFFRVLAVGVVFVFGNNNLVLKIGLSCHAFYSFVKKVGSHHLDLYILYDILLILRNILRFYKKSKQLEIRIYNFMSDERRNFIYHKKLENKKRKKNVYESS